MTEEDGTLGAEDQDGPSAEGREEAEEVVEELKEHEKELDEVNE